MPPTTTPEPEWMTWGECVAFCQRANVSRAAFIQIAKARQSSGDYELKRKRFPGCKRYRYWRASLRELLQIDK